MTIAVGAGPAPVACVGAANTTPEPSTSRDGATTSRRRGISMFTVSAPFAPCPVGVPSRSMTRPGSGQEVGQPRDGRSGLEVEPGDVEALVTQDDEEAAVGDRVDDDVTALATGDHL